MPPVLCLGRASRRRAPAASGLWLEQSRPRPLRARRLPSRVSQHCCRAGLRAPPFPAGTPGRGLPAAAYVRLPVPGTAEGRGLAGRRGRGRGGGGSCKGKVNFKTSFGREGGSGAGERQEVSRGAPGEGKCSLRAGIGGAAAWRGPADVVASGGAPVGGRGHA